MNFPLLDLFLVKFLLVMQILLLRDVLNEFGIRRMMAAENLHESFVVKQHATERFQVVSHIVPERFRRMRIFFQSLV